MTNTACARAEYYKNPPAARRAKSIAPKQHTMKASALAKYIGRHKPKGYSVTSKKFNEAQGKLLATAYQKGLTVRVIGAPRCDYRYVAQLSECQIDESSVRQYCRKKLFNKHRQMACWVRTKTQQRELWVFVFPSANYVDQVAEVIQAIFDDFGRRRLKCTKKPDVLIQHFPELERNLVGWTNFEVAVSNAVRHGDIVAIGNVDLFEGGIETLGFRPVSKDWSYSGFENMFGVKTLIDDASTKRIVLLGITESFWGQASGYFAKALLDRGARHILYGSKAATLIDDESIGHVFSPTSFYTFDESQFGSSNPIHREPEHSSQTWNSVFAPFGIKVSGSAITVPTVMGEDAAQRAKYKQFGPTCMDCENGYVARAITDHNAALRKNLGVEFDMSANFVPVHFITDYIHRDREKANTRGRHLGNPNDPDRDPSFKRIGSCFGLYALKYGLRDELRAPPQVMLRNVSSDDVSSSFEAIKPFVNAGAGLQAVLNLLAPHEGRAVPISDLIAVSFAAQKFGFSQFFESVYVKLSDPDVLRRLPDENQVQLEMLRLKMFSQVGDYDGLAAQSDRMLQAIGEGRLEAFDHLGAFQRRVALLQAFRGQRGEMLEAFRKAKKRAEEKNDRYHLLTTGLFEIVADLFANSSPQWSLAEVSGRLSELREGFNKLEHTNWRQAPIEKSAVAALYVEGAYCLKFGSNADVERGLRALYLAQLQNQRFGANETSEGYGEILWATHTPWVKSVLALSMRRDVRRFESFIRKRRSKWMVPMSHGSVAVLSAERGEREAKVRKLLKDIH